jgi:hypothetical protein
VLEFSRSEQMKKPIAVALAALLVGALAYWWYQEETRPRRLSLAVLHEFNEALLSGKSSAILSKIVMPASVSHLTTAEQSEFVLKAMHEEISSDGLASLRKTATFGPLKSIFPEEASTWAKNAGVSPDDCVAFKAEQDGLRTEVVLVKKGDSYLVVRCNNVKQLAARVKA